MRALELILSFSVGYSLVGCDGPESSEDLGDAVRAGTYSEAATRTKLFTIKPSCPTYSCGLNSPFIGHELSLAGDPNDDGVEFVGAHHLEYGPVDIEVRGDELVMTAGSLELTGEALVGLTLELEGEVDGVPVPLTVKLLEVAQVNMWASAPNSSIPPVPSYKFVYEAPEIEAQLLCPSPTEGAAKDPDAVLLAKQQVGLFDDGELDALLALNEGLEGTGRPYHSVLFAGERFDFETAKIQAQGVTDWFNWGCAGSSAAKLHLTGHTSAANARLGLSDSSPDLEQAMLYAFTATYCEGAPQMTVPGQPIRIAEVRGVVSRASDVSFDPLAPGTVEALWGPQGATCLSVPRLQDAAPEVWEEILMACPALHACEARDVIAKEDSAGVLLNAANSVITFNLATGP